MASRQGRISRQLTQWVGGTIVTLMFVFVVADYLIQSAEMRSYQRQAAMRGAEGLKAFLEGPRSLDDALASLSTAADVGGYTEGPDHKIILFEAGGSVLFATPATLPNNPAQAAELAGEPDGAQVDVRRMKVSGASIVAGAVAFRTVGKPPVRGTAVFVEDVTAQEQAALMMWGLRSGIVLLIIAGVMLAVRIPVKRFVVAPINGLFIGAYAASRDDFHRLPACRCDNEFDDLYDMFNRMTVHLSDRRDAREAAAAVETGGGDGGETIPEAASPREEGRL